MAGLPELVLEGLRGEAMRATLLDSCSPGRWTRRFRDQFVIETGDPLAILELAGGRRRRSLPGGFGLAPRERRSQSIEVSFRRRLRRLRPRPSGCCGPRRRLIPSVSRRFGVASG